MVIVDDHHPSRESVDQEGRCARRTVESWIYPIRIMRARSRKGIRIFIWLAGHQARAPMILRHLNLGEQWTSLGRIHCEMASRLHAIHIMYRYGCNTNENENEANNEKEEISMLIRRPRPPYGSPGARA